MLFKPAVTLICDIDNVSTSSLVRAKGVGGGGGALPIMDYTGMLGPKGVHFSGFRYIKGVLKLRIKYIKGSKRSPVWCINGHYVRSFEGIRLLKF